VIGGESDSRQRVLKMALLTVGVSFAGCTVKARLVGIAGEGRIDKRS